MRMKMTNDDNDNDSSNVNETIKKFYKHRVVLYIEVIRPILNIYIYFFYEKNLHAQKNIKKTQKHKNTHKQTKKAAFLCT